MVARYPQFDPNTWETVQPLIDALLEAELNDETLAPWLQRWSDLMSRLHEHSFRAYRATSEDTTDKAAEEAFLHLTTVIEPKVKEANQALREKLLAAKGLTFPAETREMLRRFQSESAIFRAENLPLESEVQRLGLEYDKITGAMSVELDGETLTMYQAAKRFLEPDRAVREEAWRAYHARFIQDRAALDALFLKLLKLRRQIAANAGFSSYRDYIWASYGRFDYTPADCATFRDAIEETIVPLVAKWNRHASERMGVETLRPWDKQADPEGRAALAPFADAEELEEGGQRIFDAVDPALGDHYRQMRDGYLDLGSRPGKANGGYCGGMFVAKVPYIFMNAVGTHDDVLTLLHEGGHAFHFMESANQNNLMWNYDGPIEFCEVASMAMELLAAPYIEREKGGFYSADDAKRARFEHHMHQLTFLPYMAVVDGFQHWVYTEAPEDVTAADLDAKWTELWERFMQGVDWSGLEDIKASGWHRKLHIFHAPFYYVEYGLAEIGALQVWRNALKDQAAALADYRAALALGNTKPLPELFAAAGATFAFDSATVGSLGALVDEHLTELAGLR